MYYFWRHLPLISSEPIKKILYNIDKGQNIVNEKAVFELDNGKFLYIRYSGVLDNENTGITDYEEFEEVNEAMRLFNEY